MLKAVLHTRPARQLDTIFTPEDLQRLGNTVEVIWGKDEEMPQEAWNQGKKEASILIGIPRYGIGTVDENAAPHLKAIMEVGGGHPRQGSVDYETCFRRSIRVLSCAPAFAKMVAELALGHALAALRNIVDADRKMRRGEEKWGWRGQADICTLYNASVGIIGYGNLARELRLLLTPFNCKLHAYDPWLPDTHLEQQGIKPMALEALLQTCDVSFVLAIPTQENRELLTREKLEQIKPGAVLVLASRSHLVDFDALIELANAGKFRATIDVYPEEPPPLDHPVRDTENTILTCHMAGAIDHALYNIGNMVTDDVEAIAAGLPPIRMQVAQPEFIARR
ncbi:hydroxyacid dehydrogenase [Candidatus Poribacteria bacterium]|nr:MAG: hydroxyacid dehydrogenase [Candidatus Poribacteria bacterium]